MQPVVIWGEILFAVNFSMDFCALYYMNRIRRMPIRRFSITLAAVLCAAVSVFVTAFRGIISPFSELMLCIVSAIGACMITHHTTRIRTVVGSVFLFVLLEALAGGIMTAMFSVFNRWFAGIGFSVSQSSVRHRLFWLSAAGLSFLFSVLFRLYTRREKRRICQKGNISVQWNDKCTDFRCIVDSGNLAKEPISGLPLIVLPMEHMAGFGIHEAELKDGKIPRSRPVIVKTVGEQELFWAIHPMQVTFYPEKDVDGGQPIDAYLIFSKHTDGQAIVPMSAVSTL